MRISNGFGYGPVPDRGPPLLERNGELTLIGILGRFVVSETRRVSFFCSLLTCFLLLFLLGASQASAWWDNNWQFRKKIHFDTMAAGIEETLNEVPVLVRLHMGNFDFSRAKNDGSDLRFVDIDDQTPLKFHIEKYDPIDAIALVWFKIPRLTGKSAANAVWMYYGNPMAAGGQSSGGSYDIHQLAVFHLSETEGFPRDATAYGNHVGNFSGGMGLPSVIGNGLTLRGMGDHLVIPRTPSLDFKNGLTFSAWVRIAQEQTQARLLSWADEHSGIILGINGTTPFARIFNRQLETSLVALSGLVPETWHHLAFTAGPNGKLTIYIDGQANNSTDMELGVPAPERDAILCAGPEGTDEFVGDLDEVRLAGIPRSAAWLRAEVQSQGPDGLLLSYGDVEKGGGGGASSFYLLTVASNITVDGWVIIGLLLLLGGLSWMIFLIKAYFFRLMINENRVFMTSFKGLTDLVDLDEKEEEFANSPLFSIYREGCRDLRGWLGKHEHLENPKISRKALNIFKTTVEKGYMDENRRINSGMVVLTMAISGGPFLGLLGTVWGVMNTFAAMAVAGEANIMAIAPGVASALATTVFGLIVAIPALFGYNYLAGRVKIIAADMGIFVDNFVNITDQIYGGD
jgi:biopolymer transport protein ExbB